MHGDIIVKIRLIFRVGSQGAEGVEIVEDRVGMCFFLPAAGRKKRKAQKNGKYCGEGAPNTDGHDVLLSSF